MPGWQPITSRCSVLTDEPVLRVHLYRLEVDDVIRVEEHVLDHGEPALHLRGKKEEEMGETWVEEKTGEVGDSGWVYGCGLRIGGAAEE